MIGEAGSGSQALAEAQALRPDLVVVEPEVPEGGPPLVADLSRGAAGCAVLVLTGGGDEGAASRALQAGARGYLVKDCAPEELVRAIERVHDGELVLASGAAEAVLKDLGTDPERASGPLGLTAREGDVLGLVVQGRTNPEIARALCITEHTVKGHVARILRKLGVGNRVELAAHATRDGLATPAPVDGAGAPPKTP